MKSCKSAETIYHFFLKQFMKKKPLLSVMMLLYGQVLHVNFEVVLIDHMKLPWGIDHCLKL